MSFTIVRRSKEQPKQGFTITRKHSNLRRMRFNGPLLDRPVQFPEDVSFMRSWFRTRGIAVGAKDCQALWVRLSIEHYPFDRDPGDYAWLTSGHMATLLGEHAMAHLAADDASHALR